MTKMMPSMEKMSISASSLPRKRQNWLISPVSGLPSRIQASAPMNEVEMNGTIEAISTTRRPGMSVRTTAHASRVPETAASTAEPVATMIVLTIAERLRSLV